MLQERAGPACNPGTGCTALLLHPTACLPACLPACLLRYPTHNRLPGCPPGCRYGDITPVTPAEQLVGMLFMVFSVFYFR